MNAFFMFVLKDVKTNFEPKPGEKIDVKKEEL